MMLMAHSPKSGFEPVQVQLSVEASDPGGYRGVSTESSPSHSYHPPQTAPARLPAPSRTASSESSSAASTSSADGFSSSASSSDASSSGLSSKAKFAIAASLGGVGGLVMLILLMVCCRRYCAAEDRHFRAVHIQMTVDRTVKSRTTDTEATTIKRWRMSGLLGLDGHRSRKTANRRKEPSPYLDPYALLRLMVLTTRTVHPSLTR